MSAGSLIIAVRGEESLVLVVMVVEGAAVDALVGMKLCEARGRKGYIIEVSKTGKCEKEKKEETKRHRMETRGEGSALSGGRWCESLIEGRIGEKYREISLGWKGQERGEAHKRTHAQGCEGKVSGEKVAKRRQVAVKVRLLVYPRGGNTQCGERVRLQPTPAPPEGTARTEQDLLRC